MICGLVIAGGRSSRFGQEKAMAEIGGRSLLARVVHVLEQDCDRVAVNARPGSGAAGFAHTHGLPLICDRLGDPAGPLAGVRAGLSWARDCGADRLATAPCDTPFLPQALVARLSMAMDDVSQDSKPFLAAFAIAPQGVQPLCAIWSVDCHEAVAASLAGGAHPPTRRLLADFGAVGVAFAAADAFLNVNSPQDRDAALEIAANPPCA